MTLNKKLLLDSLYSNLFLYSISLNPPKIWPLEHLTKVNVAPFSLHNSWKIWGEGPYSLNLYNNFPEIIFGKVNNKFKFINSFEIIYDFSNNVFKFLQQFWFKGRNLKLFKRYSIFFNGLFKILI